MVLAGWVLLPSGSFSFPELLVGFPWTHPSLLPLFIRVRGRGVLRTSPSRRSKKFATPSNVHVPAKIVPWGDVLLLALCNTECLVNASVRRRGAVMRSATTTTRPYSIALVLTLMVMLAMVAVAALGVFASSASAQDEEPIQDPFECPAGTEPIALVDQEDLSEHTIPIDSGALSFDLTVDLDANGIVFFTVPPTEIAYLVFQGPDSTIQYELDQTAAELLFTEDVGGGEEEPLERVLFCVSSSLGTTTGTTTTSTTGTTTAGTTTTGTTT